MPDKRDESGQLPASSNAPLDASTPSHRVCVCSWSLQPAGTADLVIKLKSCGIAAVQLALEPIRAAHPGFEGGFEQVLAELDEAGIEVISGMMEPVGEDYSTLESIQKTGGLRPDKYWQENLDRAHELAAACEEHGISLITLHAGFLPEDEAHPLHRVMADRIAQVAKVFGSRDVLVGLETGQERAETLLMLLDDIDEHMLGVNFDPANMLLYNMGEPDEALAMLVDYVLQVHIKDAVLTTAPGSWGTEVSAGSGQVNWKRIFATITKELPHVDCVIEREAGTQRAADIVTARKLLESGLPGTGGA